MEIKYRLWAKGIPPKPIKLEIPGWAGSHNKHETGHSSQPWHCVPFIDASCYGLELLYPFDTECIVNNKDGNITFEGDFTNECIWSEKPSPPFTRFSANHFGFTSSLDLLIPEDHVIRVEPHPRFFTDMTGTCPIAVPGHIHRWWGRIFFIAFKAPLIGQSYIFKKNEPYAQILIVPQKVDYQIEPMTEEEAKLRSKRESRIATLAKQICKKSWTDDAGNCFDDKYKQLLAIYNKSGESGIDAFLDQKLQEKKTIPRAKLLGKYIKK